MLLSSQKYHFRSIFEVLVPSRNIVSRPSAVFHWCAGVCGDNGKLCSIYFKTRLVLQRQFHNKKNGRSGIFQNSERFIGGPSPIAFAVANREGVITVYFHKHSLEVMYDDDFLTEHNLLAEVGNIRAILQLYFGYDLRVIPYKPIRWEEADIWEVPFITSPHVLYVPLNRSIESQRIVSIPGITSIDCGQDIKGYKRIHKSDLFSWTELKPKMMPFLGE